jgi:hypothetical protein
MDTAIEILAEMHGAAECPLADALALALATLEDARDRHEPKVDEVGRMLRAVLDGASRRDHATTWHFRCLKLTLTRDVIDEVERRLGLAGDGVAR